MIEYLKIELKRWIYGNPEHQELEILVEGYGKKYGLRKVLYPDELESRFEIIWKIAGEQLLEEIKKNARPD